ncbi:MAG: hypothetical protein ACLP19_27635 [Xanthobacteraceae bacterium]
MDRLTAFGLFAVSAMLVTYAFESRSHWFSLAFAGACLLGSVYGFLQGAWPFGVVEGIWAAVAFRKWLTLKPLEKLHNPAGDSGRAQRAGSGDGAWGPRA